MKHFFTLLSFNLVISIFYTIIQGFSSFSFINSFFIIGMIYFLFGCVCFVWERGFFNLTTYSFNKVQHQIHKSRGIIEDSDVVTLDDYINRKNKFYLTNHLLICGAFISTLSIVISFIYI